MKKYIVIALVLALIAGFILGLYLYKLKIANEQIAFEAEYRKLETKNVIENAENLLQETSSSKNKTTPNTKIIEKRYYNDCEHLGTTEKKIDEKLINKDESEFQIEYIGWEIQKFTPTEVVVYKEINDFCNEHYLVKEENGTVAVYDVVSPLNVPIFTPFVNVKLFSVASLFNLYTVNLYISCVPSCD